MPVGIVLNIVDMKDGGRFKRARHFIESFAGASK
jgi:hypothetical protein